MARPLRMEFAGAICHVTSRMLGSWRQTRDGVFREERDRQRFVQRLSEGVTDFGIRLYLFALTTRAGAVVRLGRRGVERCLGAVLERDGDIPIGGYQADVVLGADSHPCTYGAHGAFSTGVGSTDLAAAMITGELWFKVPESMKFVFFGKLNKWVGGKDLILHTIGDIGVDGARYRAMEFCGETIEALEMDDRLAMCNMAIEAGGKNGIIAPDKITERYVRSIKKKPRAGNGKSYASDKDAKYVEVKEYDVRKLEPLVACPNLPSNVKPARALKEVAIDQVVIGSCTNGRISDLRIAAKILRGKKVRAGVRLIAAHLSRKDKH